MNKKRDLSILSGATFLIFMGAGALQPYISPYLRDIRGLSSIQASLILTTVYFTMAFSRIFTGSIVYYLSLYLTIFLGALTYTIFIVILGYTRYFSLWIIGSLLWGIGAAMFWTGISTQVLNKSSIAKYGTSTGVLRFFTQIGLLIGFFILGQFLTKYGYSSFFLFAVLVTTLGIAITLFVSRENYEYPRLPVKEILFSMINKEAWLISLLLFVSSFSYGLILNLLNFFVKKSFGLEMMNKTLIFFYLSAGIFSLSGGIISDRIGRKRTLTFAFLIGVLGLVILLFWNNPLIVSLTSFFLGLEFAIVPTVSTAWIGDITTRRERPTVLGAISSWGNLGVAFSIIFGGLLIQWEVSFKRSFLIFAALFFFLSLLCGLRTSHEYGNRKL